MCVVSFCVGIEEFESLFVMLLEISARGNKNAMTINCVCLQSLTFSFFFLFSAHPSHVHAPVILPICTAQHFLSPPGFPTLHLFSLSSAHSLSLHFHFPSFLLSQLNP